MTELCVPAKPRELGILFRAPMVRAILAGKKTQTRRVVNPQPAKLCRFEMNGAGTHALHLGPPLTQDGPAFSCVPVGPKYTDHRLACPYGGPGDRLWVRETFEYVGDGGPHAGALYRADGHNFDGRWRPSIFMPRWASRITLEITEVRVHRLHDISEDDARAEGVLVSDAATAKQDTVDTHGMTPHRAAFACLWDFINGKAETMTDDDGEPVLDDRGRPIKIAPKAWDTNPWVWAISFRRLP